MPLSAMGLEAVNMLRRKSSSGFQWQHTNIRTHKFMATKEAVAGETLTLPYGGGGDHLGQGVP